MKKSDNLSGKRKNKAGKIVLFTALVLVVLLVLTVGVNIIINQNFFKYHRIGSSRSFRQYKGC